VAIISDHNKAEELEVLIRVLLEGPADGQTIEQIQAATKWENARVHHRLLGLGSKVGNAKKKSADRLKATHYFLKGQ
jgi:hypothetical protein